MDNGEASSRRPSKAPDGAAALKDTRTADTLTRLSLVAPAVFLPGIYVLGVGLGADEGTLAVLLTPLAIALVAGAIVVAARFARWKRLRLEGSRLLFDGRAIDLSRPHRAWVDHNPFMRRVRIVLQQRGQSLAFEVRHLDRRRLQEVTADVRRRPIDPKKTPCLEARHAKQLCLELLEAVSTHAAQNRAGDEAAPRSAFRGFAYSLFAAAMGLHVALAVGLGAMVEYRVPLIGSLVMGLVFAVAVLTLLRTRFDVGARAIAVAAPSLFAALSVLGPQATLEWGPAVTPEDLMGRWNAGPFRLAEGWGRRAEAGVGVVVDRYDRSLTVAVPVVPSTWTPDQPVALWSICEATGPRGLQEEEALRQHAATVCSATPPDLAGEITLDGGLAIERAKEAGLRSVEEPVALHLFSSRGIDGSFRLHAGGGLFLANLALLLLLVLADRQRPEAPDGAADRAPRRSPPPSP